jgi:small ligand-binding sensory domain FIST
LSKAAHDGLTDAFLHGHATHPDWRMATELALEAQLQRQPCNFGFIYFTSQLAPYAAEILSLLKSRTAIVNWVGTCGHSICTAGVEYSDEPALAIMLAQFNPGSCKVFSGLQRPPELDSTTTSGALAAFTAMVHIDPTEPDVADLVADMAAKTETGFLFGGVSSGRLEHFPQIANQTLHGGLSGVMFASDVPVHTRVTQGCVPLGPEHTITKTSEQFLQTLDGEPALDVMLADLEVEQTLRASRDGNELLKALPLKRLRQGLMVGTARPTGDRGFGFGDLTVRHVLGIDPLHRIVAIGDHLSQGDRLVFCTRDEQAARTDLIRICTELREELESTGRTIRGAHYVSCVARAGQLFGGPATEMRLIQSNLGDVPLIGFYANGEIGRDRLYGYTGVLTVFS